MCSTSSVIVLFILRGLVTRNLFFSSKNHDLCFCRINEQLVSFQPSRNMTNFIVEVIHKNFRISVLVKKCWYRRLKINIQHLLCKTGCQARSYFQSTLRYAYIQFFPNFSQKQEVLKLGCNFQSSTARQPLTQGPLKQL